MSDDIFSQLFNLFSNNDDEVNWKLAKQINNHLNKEENQLTFSNKEVNYEEIFKVIKLNISDSEILDFKLLSKKQWGEWFIDSIQHFDFSKLSNNNIDFGFGNLQSSLLGMQLGNLTSFLAKNTFGLSHFGILLPKSNTLAINYQNFDKRVNQFDVNENELVMALMTIEYIALSMGKYEAPFQFLIDKLNESNSSLISSFQDNSSKIDFENFTNPQEIMNSIPEMENFNLETFFDPILGPLSFYREVIKVRSKELLTFLDKSVVDLVMDLSFIFENSSSQGLEQKLASYEDSSKTFINFLSDSVNVFTLDEILSDTNLIPSLEEILDPIAWAARTSLPPI
ncbi:MAG: hypothetical protein O3A48_03725 [Actinomycetota bacterium]|nr:hypothetical protein [Actinomycetota bacterium]MDA3013630.1 hypothetical protein [Actinomycetota bacterium]